VADDFGLEGKSIDAGALQSELAARVARRRESGACPPEVEALLAERLPDEADYGKLPPIAELDHASKRAMASWEVSAAYPIDTEKGGLARPVVMFVKRLARLWARIAVGPIQNNQIAFNRNAANALEALRRQAVAERAEALAAEKDLSELAGAMLEEGEASRLAAEVKTFLADARRLTVVGPVPAPLVRSLKASGLEILAVSAGSSWDASADEATSWGAAPLSFLSQCEEGSQQALLFSELAFWLRPEALITLARRSYVVLAHRGKIVISVCGFAAAGPVPAWVSGPVVKKVLSMAGFIDIAIVRPPEDSSYVATARKP
jgi:hypothetical protein